VPPPLSLSNDIFFRGDDSDFFREGAGNDLIDGGTGGGDGDQVRYEDISSGVVARLQTH